MLMREAAGSEGMAARRTWEHGKTNGGGVRLRGLGWADSRSPTWKMGKGGLLRCPRRREDGAIVFFNGEEEGERRRVCGGYQIGLFNFWKKNNEGEVR